MSPYIKEELRFQLDCMGVPPMIAGELNYRFAKEVVRYVKNRGLNYQVANDVMGAFIGSLLEFYIRVVRPYEDIKIEENGDVYEEIIPRPAGGSRPSSQPGSLLQESGRSPEPDSTGSGTSGSPVGS